MNVYVCVDNSVKKPLRTLTPSDKISGRFQYKQVSRASLKYARASLSPENIWWEAFVRDRTSDSFEGMGPKTLFIDIENSASLGWSYEFYDTNLTDILRDWSIFCFSWKWLGEEKVHLDAIKKPKDIWDFVKHPDNDYQIVRHIWRLLDEAEIVVAHNGRRFDTRKITSRFLYFDLKPPSPYKIVDTLVETRKVSANTRNNLDYLVKHWKIGEKMENDGWRMHRGYMAGDAHYRSEMHKYCKRDTEILEPVYKHLLPYITSHPNVSMWTNFTCCPNCKSKNLESRGWAYNKTTKYKRLVCKDCGRWMRTSKNEKEIKPLVGI